MDMLAPQLHYTHQEVEPMMSSESEQTILTSDETDVVQPFVRSTPKVGRNDPCYCGSGKKFKQCHGDLS